VLPAAAGAGLVAKVNQEVCCVGVCNYLPCRELGDAGSGLSPVTLYTGALTRVSSTPSVIRDLV
jgi:hypothetical protein